MSVEQSVDLLVDPFGSAYPFEVPVDSSWSPSPSADEIAVLAELARLFPPDPDRPVHREDLPPWDRDDLPDLEDRPDREDQPTLGSAPAAAPDGAAAAILAAAARAEGCGAGDLALLEATDPASLDDPLARVAYVKVLNRVEAAIAARRYDTVLSLVPVMGHESDYLAEGAREIDLAVACRSSLRAARQMIDAARATRLVFPGMLEALAAGRVSDRHVRILLERTRVIDDAATLVLIGEQALPLAEQLIPARFEDALEQVIIAFDPDAPARRRKAHADRDVWACRLPDGMAFLGIKSDAATVAAMHDRIRAAAKDLQAARGGTAAVRAGNTDASLHACAADAAAAIILGTTTPDGEVVFDPAAQTVVHVQLVIDLETLRGEREHPALLHGCPVPASMARDIAGYATAFRRIVTDPVTGVALDYGREYYLPRPLREYVLHRDGGCRIPGCGCRTISLLQMDHAQRFPLGPSTPANTGGISPRCHHIKTAGFFDLVDGEPDGSVTLVTLLGQRVRIPPRPFMGWHPPDLPPPGRAGPDPGDPGDDTPPF